MVQHIWNIAFKYDPISEDKHKSFRKSSMQSNKDQGVEKD